MIKPTIEVQVTEQFPTYGYTQKEIRYLAVDHQLRVFEAPDGAIYCIHHNGEVDPHRRDLSGWWLEKLEDYL
ncbi:hypothetical protein [Pectobacterium phage PcCB7V]|uniref:hypothetical protein n=1 Tax=Escherichia coli TaxID=562 RepID=UPI001BB5E8AA|nr:hypothetical protein [Pectobacterium phage PcCB7V]